MSYREALALVLELAESNALSVREIRDEPSLYDESVRQQEALQTVRDALNTL
jgi:hypothetical protein